MKKLKYYAPYWVSALVLMLAITVYMLFFRFHPFSELPELAAELESNEYFIREDGAVMKNTGKSEAFPAAQPVEANEGKRYKVRNPEAKPLAEMLPHEYAALICDEHIFVRKDGKVFITEFAYLSPRKAYLQQLCPPSELPEDASEAEIEVTGERDWYSEHHLASIAVRTPVENNAATLNWYLSVRLSDGWYIISEGTHHSIIVDNNTPYFHILSSFPALHEGDYRLEFNTGSRWAYRELTLTRKDTDNYTLSY